MAKNKGKKSSISVKQASASSTSSRHRKPSEEYRNFDIIEPDKWQGLSFSEVNYNLDYIQEILSKSSLDDANAFELAQNALLFIDAIEDGNICSISSADSSRLKAKVYTCLMATSRFLLRNTQQKTTNAVEAAKRAAETAAAKASDAAAKASNAAAKLEEDLKHTTDSTLTIMGIFATIITVILSVVVTSSAWLNNANGASAVVAFVVPSLVAVSATIVLLGIILADRSKRSKAVRRAGIAVVIVAIFLLVSWRYTTHRDANLQHSRYILSPGMYQIDGDGENRAFTFKIETDNYTVPYKESYFHKGKTLQFCMQHKSLE